MNDLNKRRENLSAAQRALLEKRLKSSQTPARPKPTTIPRRASTEAAPASFGQQRLWFLHQLNPQNPAYNMVNAVQIKGDVDQNRLEQSLQTIGDRHEALRTTFAMQNGILYQRIDPTLKLSLKRTVIDEAHDVNHQIVKIAQQPFNLAEGPLIRADFVEASASDATLVLVIHHIVCDEWSIDVIWRELSGAYAALSADNPPALKDLPIQYADYAAWQHQRDEMGAYDAQLDHWRDKLAGDLPLLQLPQDHPRSAIQQFEGQLLQHDLDASLSTALREFSKSSGTTLFATLMAAYTLMLHRYTGQEDILVGTPVANRKLPEVENLIGFFLNTVVLRSNFADAMTFRDYLQQTRQQALAAIANSDVPFDRIIDAIKPPRHTSHNPTFQAMFVYNDRAAHNPSLSDFTLEPLLVDMGVSKFDLTLFAQEQDETIRLGLEYNSQLFNKNTMQRFLVHFETLLRSIVAAPDTLVSELTILPAEERDLLLKQWANGGETATAPRLVHDWIDQQPADHFAIKQGNHSLTYGDLNQRANQIANQLVTQGVQTNTPVGISIERSPDMLIGILGILKAGGAYVPIDPEYPAERVNHIIRDAGIKQLLTSSQLASQFAAYEVEVVLLDDEQITSYPDTPPQVSIQPDDLAYVIYTSGSTGKPKGVRISHGNLAHSTAARFDYYPHQVERFLLLSSFAFDSSLVGIFWALCAGGTLILPPHQGERDIPDIARLIDEQKVTHTLALPSLYQILLEYAAPEQLKTLNTVMVAGEACSLAVVRQHYESVPHAHLYNEYGPTEGTVWSTVWEIPENAQRILIGKPIQNVEAYVLDANQQPVPIGVTGELYIGGAGIAQGYHNRPDLTGERFIKHPFGDDRLYRTGDLVRFLPDGNLEFLGRVDFQVKISGYRIELGEIEQALTTHDGVREAVVLAMQEAGDHSNVIDIFELAEQVQQQGAEPLLAEIEAMHDDEVEAIINSLLGNS